ncbi:MAG: cation diffusion facilitator family transporter [Heliobacteriaceae bacterium]|nr:cation diffusion facilitator family transporter [Heliobacteriaceae bacterium]
MKEQLQVARLSVVSNTFLVVGKLVAGLVTGSVSVLSEGIHSGLDLVAALVAFFSVREAARPADEKHNFGHGKFENVAGTVEALLIFIAALWIIWEAGHKLAGGGGPPDVGWGIVVMGLSAVVNLYVSSRLFRVARKTDSVALEADGLHLRTDVYTSLGVMTGLVLIRVTGWWVVDPLIALAVALLILKAAWKLLREAFFPLLDQSLPFEEGHQINERIKRHAGQYIGVHAVRTRRAGAERHIDMHVVFCRRCSLGQSHKVAHEITAEIEALYPKARVLVHQEPCEEEKCRGCENETGGSDPVAAIRQPGSRRN